MKILITGSPSFIENHLESYLPSDVTEILCCSNKGIDLCAKIYAIRSRSRGGRLRIFIVQYHPFYLIVKAFSGSVTFNGDYGEKRITDLHFSDPARLVIGNGVHIHNGLLSDPVGRV